MWKCKNCGGEVFEISKIRINDYRETVQYVSHSYKCEDCSIETSDFVDVSSIAEWVK